MSQDDKYMYRFVAACGVERRDRFSPYWREVTGEMLKAMTADELETVVKAMREPKP